MTSWNCLLFRIAISASKKHTFAKFLFALIKSNFIPAKALYLFPKKKFSKITTSMAFSLGDIC
jgi:hypothetical protein